MNLLKYHSNDACFPLLGVNRRNSSPSFKGELGVFISWNVNLEH